MVSARALGRVNTQGFSASGERTTICESSCVLSCKGSKEGLNRRGQLSQARCEAQGLGKSIDFL